MNNTWANFPSIELRIGCREWDAIPSVEKGRWITVFCRSSQCVKWTEEVNECLVHISLFCRTPHNFCPMPFELGYLGSRQFSKMVFCMFPSTFNPICMNFHNIMCLGVYIGLLEGILVKNRKVLVTRFIQLALCWPSVAVHCIS